jgi:hypothetical protein
MNPSTDIERFANAFGHLCEVFEKAIIANHHQSVFQNT